MKANNQDEMKKTVSKQEMERLEREGNLPKLFMITETHTMEVVATDNEMKNWDAEQDIVYSYQSVDVMVDIDEGQPPETDKDGNGYVNKLLMGYDYLEDAKYQYEAYLEDAKYKQKAEASR